MGIHHTHSHAPPRGSSRVLLAAVGITAGYALVEAIGGWLSGSLALLADAGHMVSDAMALGLAAGAAIVAQRPATTSHTFGLGRVEVVAATFNAFFLLGVVAAVAWAAIGRLQNPVPVSGGTVLLIASAGLVINVVVAWMLSRGVQSLNVRAAFLHVLGDLLGSVAALVSGAVILLTGWTPIDPLLSLFICALIVVSCIRLLREALHVVMEAVPRDLELEEVGRAMAAVDGVREVHDLHIWQVASGSVMLTAHLIIDSYRDWDRTHLAVREVLERNFDITHVTLQPEALTK
ncbi:MAG: cation diffusion facilitator family transporter [Xanthomonadaceae bacterium]|nr:cation diffusion facilitator family transporter [Xanthomonadaceae bacterium]